MRDRDQKKKPNWVPILVLLMIFVPELVIFVAIFGGIVYLVYTNKKNGSPNSDGKTTYSQKKLTLDDLVCFHKDKGEHHVARGKEIDPWDRPDIDISKYQRKS